MSSRLRALGRVLHEGLQIKGHRATETVTSSREISSAKKKRPSGGSSNFETERKMKRKERKCDIVLAFINDRRRCLTAKKII